MSDQEQVDEETRHWEEGHHETGQTPVTLDEKGGCWRILGREGWGVA